MADGRLTLHFVRHGETQFNSDRRIQGQLDAPLSQLGLQQAAALAQEIARCTATALYSSDLSRAMDTAAPLAAQLGLKVLPEPALRERHFGALQGRLYADVEAIVKEWWTRPDERYDGGETNREMHARVGAFLERLRAAPPAAEIILVSHGGAINMALAHLAGATIEEMTWQRLPNCALTTVETSRAE